MPISTDGSLLFLDPTCDHEGCLYVVCDLGTPEYSPLDRSPITAAELETYVRTGAAPAWSSAAARDGSLQDLVIRLTEGDRASFGYDRHAVGIREWFFRPCDGASMLAGKAFPISDPARQALLLRAMRAPCDDCDCCGRAPNLCECTSWSKDEVS